VTEAPTEAGSSIYDLRYRRYEGERLGRRHAILALYVESLRGAFGLGRSAAAKVAPVALIVIALVPAAVQLVAASLFDVVVIRASEYYWFIKYPMALYCAVVAPDIAGRDQRNRSLTLYFSRAISRADYAIAKFAAMATAMLMVTLVPQVVLFLGAMLAAADLSAYMAAEWDQILPILGSALLSSALIAGIGITIAAYTPHRAFATVGIIIAFIVPLVVAGIVVTEINTDATRYAVFASTMDVIDGLAEWMFGASSETDTITREAGFDAWVYGPVALVVTLIAGLLLVRRYRTVLA
jgi:ABC-2 type transport system permease protein